MNNIILNWPETLAAGSAISGGKGFQLARLHQYGFSIPRGFVLSAELYRQQLPQHGQRSDFLNGKLPDNVLDNIEAALRTHGLADKALAIRSSATHEDSATTSFAGIHDSLLNVQGRAAIEKAILQCYASLWSERAVSYRRKMNIDDNEIACAVVISELVEADSAGIAFSCDPASGRTDRIAINANFGLGESVVSGAGQPDHYLLDYHTQDIVEQTLGQKGKRSIVTPQGTALVDQTDKAATAVLNKDQLAQLGRLVMRIYHTLGQGEQHQDVEWLFTDDTLVVSQARPVTALTSYTLPELIGEDETWTAGNFRDAIPMVLPALSRGFARTHIDNIMRHAFDGSGYALPDGLNFGRLYQGRFYCNATLMQWLWYDVAGMDPAITNLNLGGHQATLNIDTDKHDSPKKKLQRLLRTLKFLRYVDQHKKNSPAIFADVRGFIDHVLAKDLTTLNDTELLDLYLSIDQRIYDYDAPFITLTSASGAIFVIIQILEKKFGAEAPNIANALLAGKASITSADQGYELLALAEQVSNDTAALAWFNSETYQPQQWKEALPDDSPFKQGFSDYLGRYGHRAVYEIDFTRPRWSEDPSYLLDTIKNAIGKHQLSAIKTQQQQQAAQAWARVDRELSWATRKLLRYFARRATEGAAVREMAKSTYVKCLTPVRGVILEIGSRLAAQDLIATTNDIFHCDNSELIALLKGEWDGKSLPFIIEQRKQQQQQLQTLTPPDVIINNTAERAVPRKNPSNDSQLLGIAVAPGNAIGPAHVALTPEQGSNIGTGYVLVTPSTDPGWTPLFLHASALVMETGGYLSHGAIVAREYGIPAVVNVAGVMDQINNNAIVIVNGDQGTVEITS